MNKAIRVNDILYNIQVKLNWLVEKKIDGKRQHKVIITSPNLTQEIEYLIEDIKKELPAIEKELYTVDITMSKEEQILKDLGYNSPLPNK